MKTAFDTLTTDQRGNLSDDILKALALKQFNSESFFFADGVAYEGEEKEVKSDWESAVADLLFDEKEPLPITPSFEEYCAGNCIKIKGINGDDEVDGYIVLTDEEAIEKAGEYIKQSLWAFNPSFLSGETGISIRMFEALAENGKYESNNEAIESCIDDMDSFIESAISADGRGHFISSYNGQENEETVNEQVFYIYRMN